MALYNVSKIENWYDDFSICKKKYKNTYYEDYIESYIRKSSDSTIILMRTKLNEHYGKINRIYSRIDTFWKDYLDDLKNTDAVLAGNKKSGSVNASSVSSKLAKLPMIKEYDANLNIKFKAVSGLIGTAKVVGWAENKTIKENLIYVTKKYEATMATVATSIYSGLLKLDEHLADGLIWCGGMIASGVTWLFDDEISKKIQEGTMNVIAYDVVGKANEAFYEKTNLGRSINEYSAIKYDSKVAKTIQTGTEVAAEVIAATALTVATGGTAAPLAAAMVASTGFMIGAGKKAEEDFSKEDRSFFGDAGEIAFAGAIKAIEFYSTGQMGAGVINATKAISSAGGVKSALAGIKGAFSKGGGKIFSKDLLKSGVKATLTDVDTYFDSFGAAVDNIAYDKQTGVQVNWSGLAKETACNFALNFVTGYVGNVFQNRMVNSIKNDKTPLASSVDDTLENVKNTYTSQEKTSMWLEYNDLVNKVDTQEFRYYKDLADNGGAGDLNKIQGVVDDVERMKFLEEQLGIPKDKTSIPAAENWRKYDKNSADELAKKVNQRPIPGFENIDTNSPERITINDVNRQFLEIRKSTDINYEAYVKQIGMEIKDFKNETDLAIELGDENWYLVQVLKNNEKNMSLAQLQTVEKAYLKPRSELDTVELINLAGPFLKEEDIINLNEIGNHPNMSNLSLQNKNTIHQFQRCGGCEVNGMLRGKDYSRLGLNSLTELEMGMNINSHNAGHSRIVNNNYSIVDEIDDIIKNNSNTSIIKGVSYLDSVGPNAPTGQVLDIINQFGPNSPEALQALNDLIGVDITDSAFNSKTIPPTRDTNYSRRFRDLKIGEARSLDLKVESYISPGCAAYIDTYGGIQDGLGEIIIKRNCAQHIIDAYVDPNTNKLVLVTLYE